MFDLRRDPNEVNNIAEQPEYAEMREELTKELRRLQEQYRERG